MTFSKRLQKLGLWTFTNCHWPVNDTFWASLWKLSLTGQWQFRSVSKILDCGFLDVISRGFDFKSPSWDSWQWRLQKVGLWTFRNCHWPVNDSLGASPKNWIVDSYKLSFTSQWHFLNILLKTVIDWSMTLLRRLQKLGLWTFTNCHWPVNDTFGRAIGNVSLTSQWHFLNILVKSVIDRSLTF